MKAFAVLVAILLAASAAQAQTDEIQVYDASIAKPGVFNLTLHDNYTFSGRKTPDYPGGLVPDHLLNGVPEWAYGVTDWFEAGLYLPLYSRDAHGQTHFNGAKLRALFVSPNADERTFFYGINFEFSYNQPQWDQKRFTSEIRPIVGWHLGRVDLIFNPILDNSYDGVSRLDFAPSSRIAYHVTPDFALAAEEYDDFGPLRGFHGTGAQSHQLFAAVDYTALPVAVETGLGFGLSRGADNMVMKLILSRDLN